MNNGKQQTFKNWYVMLPAAMLLGTREHIERECGISTSTFYDWLNNPHRIKPPARAIICKIAGIEAEQMDIFFKTNDYTHETHTTI
jgi:hypothetical protein